jgi:hypothetical protein
MKKIRYGILLTVMIIASQNFRGAPLGVQRINLADDHAKNDAEIAQQSGLKIADVRKLRELAGVSDESTDLIDSIDTSILAEHGLVVLARHGGTAVCVNFWVFARTDGIFKEIWNSGEAGDEAASFCADPKCSMPAVKVRNNRDVVVEIPSYRGGRCAVRSEGIFLWNGTGYTYKGLLKKVKAAQAK